MSKPDGTDPDEESYRDHIDYISPEERLADTLSDLYEVSPASYYGFFAYYTNAVDTFWGSNIEQLTGKSIPELMQEIGKDIDKANTIKLKSEIAEVMEGGSDERGSKR